MNPRVFTIPASAPFLPTLIEALTSGRLGFAVADGPLGLASATLLLATRRARRHTRRGAEVAASTQWAGAAPAADAARRQMGQLARTARTKRHAARGAN